MRRSTLPRAGMAQTLRRRPISRSNPRDRRPLAFEPLEDRTLLATLNITGSTISGTSFISGTLTYTGSTTATGDTLSVKTATVNDPSDPTDGYTYLMYTITYSPNDPITLGSGAVADGWKAGTAADTVTGPGSEKLATTGATVYSFVTAVSITMQSGNDTATIASTGAATSLDFSNVAGNADTVTLGGTGGTRTSSAT